MKGRFYFLKGDAKGKCLQDTQTITNLCLFEFFEFDILFRDSFLASSLNLNHCVSYMKNTHSPIFILW